MAEKGPAGLARWQILLRRAALLVFLACFGSIFLVTGLRGNLSVSPLRLVLLAALGAGAFWLCRKGLPLLDGLSARRWDLLFYGGLALLLALQLGSGFLLVQDLTTSPFDTEAVLRTATELAQGIVPAQYNDYFSSVDTNVFCMFVLYWLYRPVYLLTGSTGPEWAMALNTLFLFFAAFAICRTALGLWGRRGGGAALILCFLFLPFYIFTSFVYTDTMAAGLVAGGLWAFTALVRHWPDLKKAGRLAGCAGLGALLAAAFLMKGNALLLYPAMGAYLLLTLDLPGLVRRRWRSALASLLLAALGSAAVLTGFNAYKQNCGLLDFSLYESMHTPITHWIMMGLEHDGAFSNESFAYTAQFPTIEEKKAGNLARIRTNLQHLFGDPQSLAWLVFTKADTDWMDGLFSAPQTTGLAPLRHTWLHEWFSVDGAHASLTADFGQAFYWLVWAGAFLAAVKSLRRRWPGENALLLCCLCLLANLAFLTLWEANSRYPFCYCCCMLLPLAGLLAAGRTSD